ncbi:MAG: 50S ribosomal protein L30 [Robiginitomaculum sp.]
MAKAAKKKTLTVRQTGSSTRRPKTQHATLVGLGLGRIGKQRILEDTPSIRGAISKVAHMVEIIEN